MWSLFSSSGDQTKEGEIMTSRHVKKKVNQRDINNKTISTELNKKYPKVGVIIGIIALFFTFDALVTIGDGATSGVGSFACFLGIVAVVFELPVFLESKKTKNNYQKSIITMVLISTAILGSLIAIITDGVIVKNKKQALIEKCKTSLDNLDYNYDCSYKLKNEDEGHYDSDDFIKKCNEKGGEIIKNAYHKNIYYAYRCKTKEEVEKDTDTKKKEEEEVSRRKNECETNGGQWQYDNTCRSKEKLAEEKETSKQECNKKQNYVWDGNNCTGKEWFWQGNERSLNSDSRVSSNESKIVNEVFNAVERKSKKAYILDSGDGRPWTVTIKMNGDSLSDYTVVFYIEGDGNVYRVVVKNGTIID